MQSALILLGSLIGIWLVLNVVVYIFQEQLIFRGAPVDQDYSYEFNEGFEEVTLKTDDHANLHALHFKVKNPKGCILYFHGNQGDLSKWGSIASDLTRYGFDVLMPDYRGYGKSTGKRSEHALYQDAELWLNHVNKSGHYQNLIYYGRSLGSGFAVNLAMDHPPDLLILETPFSKLSDAIRSYGFLYRGVLGKFELDSYAKAKAITSPVLVICGTWDVVVPAKYSRRLFEKISSKQKKIIEIDKGGHNNLNNFEIYHETLKVTFDNWISDGKNH